ncbi:hypothetical protein F0U60_23935 [Archangium minus]|uniref:Lipoprotein n=1 Tax=Archangium minus TaxID=83450 RepID=A0ABY9WSR3_9BACT|nr:hypothetical protein F0U61_24030 [Archangium violaceum]WNG46832.1 hypothetical protein F0U60_23935 [Archangium minus]
MKRLLFLTLLTLTASSCTRLAHTGSTRKARPETGSSHVIPLHGEWVVLEIPEGRSSLRLALRWGAGWPR